MEELRSFGPDSRSASWIPFYLISLVLHVAILGGVVVWNEMNAETEPEPIPISLLEEEAPPPPEPEPAEEEPPAPRFEFRERPTAPRVRERLEIPPEATALAPPPPDVELAPSGAAGGLAIDAPRVSALGSFTLEGEGGGTAGHGVGAGNAMGGIGTFQDFLASLREAGLDVVLVIDSSGSMGWVLSAVRDRIQDLARAVRRLVPVTRFGVVAYRDYDDPEFVTRFHPLTLSIPKLRRFLDDLSASGGGDVPEAIDAGLRVAFREGGWTQGARRVVIIVGDAPPHSDRMDEVLSLTRGFRQQGGVVTAVDVGFDANPCIAAAQLGTPVHELTTLRPRGVLEEYQVIARAGGGDATTLEGDRQVIRQLGVLIFGRQWAEQVDPLLEGL